MRTFRHGDMGAATKEAEEAYRKFHGGSAEWAWRFRLLEANALIWRGIYGRPLSLLTSETAPLPIGELTIEKHRLEGLAYTSLPDLARADESIRKAEELCEASQYSVCTNVILARGGLEMAQGHFEQAETAFKQTLDRARSLHNTFAEANSLLSLSWSALQQEHFDEALDWAGEARSQSVALDAGHILQDALGNQGWAYYRLGEPEKALALLLEARNRAHEIAADAPEVTWLTTAGYVYLDAKDYTAAQQSYQHGLDLAEKINSNQDIIDAMVSLALVSERSGNMEHARDYADRAIKLVPAGGNRLDILYPMLVKGHVAERMHDAALAEKTFLEIEQDHESHFFLKWEAEHALAQLYEDENKPDLTDREYRAALSTFETARSALQHEESSLPFPANASAIYDDYIHFLVSKGKTAEALQVAEYSRGRNLAENLGLLKKGTPFKLDTLNAQAIARRAGGTILFYWLGEKQSYLWAITAQTTSLFSLPPKAEIDPIVQRYRKALAEQQEFLQIADDDGRALYRTLVAPALAAVAKDAKVFIIPDGSLNRLNFETLLAPDPKPHYWIEDVTIADASSLRLLAAPRAAAKHAGGLLLAGNAVAPNPDYPELRKAAAEMDVIEKHFAPAQQRIFAREQATPTAYLASKPEQFSYIHFVAHGTASRTSPLDSAIVLSRATAEDDSFKLYARDIIHHPLQAELVTISTCYGAGSRAYSGEGLVGLSWAFIGAGAHNVIGALWEVSDVSTPQLMDELYGSLKKGDSPQTALRAAKISLLHSSGPFRKPFYWAPFQLYTGS
ncbi:MAG TPA: CHAT domain-containing protein [Candidatus Sulfotelmatobacter sp.]|nr:CHAT domain-containing protein [Candidatus Sulfotelmatobacter sp.]